MVTAAMKLKTLAPWKKIYDQPRQRRDIILLTKVHLVKAMVFPVVTYGCESWTIKSTEELMLLNCGALFKTTNTEESMLLNCSVGEDS